MYPTATAPTPLSTSRDNRLASAAALTFVILLIIQNLLKAATSPANDADPAHLMQFLDHRAWTVHLLAVTYVLGYPALLLFATGLARQATALAPEGELWARLGQSSVIVIAVLFGILNVLQVTMVATRGVLAHQPDTLLVLWALHNAVFTINLIALAGALLGLSRAAVLAHLIPRWLARTSLAGAALLALASAPAVAQVQGSKLLTAGLAGFLVWLVFLLTAAIRLLRGDQPHQR